MKLFLFPFLVAVANSARVSRVSESSPFLMHEYLYDDLAATIGDAKGGRKLGNEPIGHRHYELKKVVDVAGRQGVATNGTHYFVSGSTSLYTYDMEGTLLKENLNPFVELDKAANHFGDIGYYDGQIYTGAEWFADGRGRDIQIALYDAETLNFTRSFPWEPDSGQVEVSALTVDTDNGLVWMTDWVKGNFIYSYNLTDGEYMGKIHLRAEVEWTQGIAFYKGDLYITADDGVADRKETDNLWKVPAETLGQNATYIRHELSFEVPEHFRDWGEIEGIDFNRETDEMIVLTNRGRRIVLGTPMEFYPGYTKEIHEVYVFSLVDDDIDDDDDDTSAGATPHSFSLFSAALGLALVASSLN